MQFSDRPENQVGAEWGGQFAEALLRAGVKASSGSRKRRSTRTHIPRSKTATHIETTRVRGADGSTKVLRERPITVRLVHTNKTAEVERLKENGWVFPDTEIVEEV